MGAYRANESEFRSMRRVSFNMREKCPFLGIPSFRVFWGGEPVLIGGTSDSSPAFAGIVALLNGARLSAGLPPLGFLNPFLYSTGSAALNDVTSVSNSGCFPGPFLSPCNALAS